MLRKFKGLGILLCTLLLLFCWQTSSNAQTTTQLESRLSRLEFENDSLRSSLSQIQAQLSRLSPNARIDISPGSTTSGRAPAASALAEDPTFKNLATLVIELKERVVVLENQVAAIASNRSPQS
jgi:uncharacterized protein YceH (UPF0502 family)